MSWKFLGRSSREYLSPVHQVEDYADISDRRPPKRARVELVQAQPGYRCKWYDVKVSDSGESAYHPKSLFELSASCYANSISSSIKDLLEDLTVWKNPYERAFEEGGEEEAPQIDFIDQLVRHENYKLAVEGIQKLSGKDDALETLKRNLEQEISRYFRTQDYSSEFLFPLTVLVQKNLSEESLWLLKTLRMRALLKDIDVSQDLKSLSTEALDDHGKRYGDWERDDYKEETEEDIYWRTLKNLEIDDVCDEILVFQWRIGIEIAFREFSEIPSNSSLTWLVDFLNELCDDPMTCVGLGRRESAFQSSREDVCKIISFLLHNDITIPVENFSAIGLFNLLEFLKLCQTCEQIDEGQLKQWENSIYSEFKKRHIEFREALTLFIQQVNEPEGDFDQFSNAYARLKKWKERYEMLIEAQDAFMIGIESYDAQLQLLLMQGEEHDVNFDEESACLQSAVEKLSGFLSNRLETFASDYYLQLNANLENYQTRERLSKKHTPSLGPKLKKKRLNDGEYHFDDEQYDHPEQEVMVDDDIYSFSRTESPVETLKEFLIDVLDVKVDLGFLAIAEKILKFSPGLVLPVEIVKKKK